MFWQRLKEYCNTHLNGFEAKRSQIVDGLNRIATPRITTVDCYLNYLHKAGYLGKPRRGWYTLDHIIPTDLSIEDVKSEAYGIIDYDGNRRVIPGGSAMLHEHTRVIGLEAHEKKHEYFSREEFEIAS